MDLQLHQILSIYEGLGWMISAEGRPELKVQYISAALQFVHKEF